MPRTWSNAKGARAVLLGLAALVGLACNGFAADAPTGKTGLRLSELFSDNMVLQCELPAPVWGTARAGTRVTVKFRDQAKETTAGADGHWRVVFDKLAPGGPDEMTIAAAETIALKNILVGEVWVCSGQSNMAQHVSTYTSGDPVLSEMVATAHPQVRLLVSRKPWRESTPDEARRFSAQAFAFGVHLHRELKRPVGIMVGAASGTPSGRWLDREMFLADRECVEAFQRHADNWSAEADGRQYEKQLARYETKFAAANDEQRGQMRKPKPPVKPDLEQHQFGNLYEQLIKRFTGYGIRGVLWDQGEYGTQVPGVSQDILMRALITGWRKAWGWDVPFIYVQKPSGGGCAFDPGDPVTSQASPFAPLPSTLNGLSGANRELYIRIMRTPNTAMAIASDLGAGIHPINKSGYAARGARVALGFVYGRPVEYLGPVYKAHTVEGNAVRVRFDHVGKGLVFRHGEKLQGFAVAGDDRIFRWADAVIEKDTVTVTAAGVEKPVAVRYAWGGNIAWANLFNQDGLPALTFRTDNWEAPAQDGER